MEELGQALAERARAIVGGDATLALIGPMGRMIWSSMEEGEGALACEVVRKLGSLWNKGDYYVANLGGRKAVIVKATDKICLALAASAKEGVLLFAARSMINAFSERLRELEAGLAEEGERGEVEVYPVEVLDPETGREVKVVPADAVPYVPEDVGPVAVELDARSIALLKAADGKTVAELARELGMGIKEACELVARLLEKRVLRAKVVEEVRSDYETIYVPKVGLSGEDLAARGGLRPFEKFVLLNLGRGYTVMELSWGLRGLGYNIRPSEILDLLRGMEEEGLVEKLS